MKLSQWFNIILIVHDMALNVTKSIAGYIWNPSKIFYSNICDCSKKPKDLVPKSLDDKVEVKTKRIQIKGDPRIHLLRPEQDCLKGKIARITKPTKNCMQSGTENTRLWQIQFEELERWENPCMGWGSSGDPVSSLKIKFTSKEQAIAFCEKNNWRWYTDKSQEKKRSKRSYADNFSFRKRSRVSTK